jgi:molybdopterin biosynthesis enzyme
VSGLDKGMDLLNVRDAVGQLLAAFGPVSKELISIHAARERVLAESIRSDQAWPPFANSSMDGFAVLASDVAHASPEHAVVLKVVGIFRRTKPTVDPAKRAGGANYDRRAIASRSRGGGSGRRHRF